MGSPAPITPDELIKDSQEWSGHLEVRALQPQRELSPDVEFLIGARQTCEVNVSATIFADTLSEPVVQNLVIRIEVEQLAFSSADIVEVLTDVDEDVK